MTGVPRLSRILAAGAVATVLGLLSPARAQMSPVDIGQGFSGIYQTIHFNTVLTQRATEDQAARNPDPGKLTTFRPSPEVRRRNLAGFVEKTRAADPEGAAALERLFASSDVIGEIGQALAPYSLRTNDVADATAVYLVTAWYGVRGRDDDPSRAQLTAVRGQMARARAATPAFASLTDAHKQELAEAMLIQAALVGASVTAAKDQPTTLEGVKRAVAQGVSATFDFDLSTLDLTDQGLRAR